MKRKTIIYECDICSAIALPDFITDSSGGFYTKPFGWHTDKRGKAHMCAACYKAFERLKKERGATNE